MSSNLGIVSVSLAPLPAFFLKEDNCLLHISIFGGKSGAPIVLTSPLLEGVINLIYLESFGLLINGFVYSKRVQLMLICWVLSHFGRLFPYICHQKPPSPKDAKWAFSAKLDQANLHKSVQNLFKLYISTISNPRRTSLKKKIQKNLIFYDFTSFQFSYKGAVNFWRPNTL